MSAIQSPLAVVRPIRTCVGCRRTAAKSQLLRVVCIDGVVTADRPGRADGRGAYLHHDPACLAAAEARRAFRRAFRLDVAPAVDPGLRQSLTTTQHAGA